MNIRMKLGAVTFYREIILNTRHNLVEVRHKSKEAVFEKLDHPEGERVVFEVIFCDLL